MDQNVILKDYLHVSAENVSRQRSKNQLDDIFSDVNPFTLFNILGKNQLFAFALILIILYAWFVRAEIKLGSVFGFIFLGFIFFIYFKYTYYSVRDYTLDKQKKTQLLSAVLDETNYFPTEGALPNSENYFNLDGESNRNLVYTNPAAVDFYYSNKDFLSFAYYNYARSLQYVNYMIVLQNQMLLGVNNRGNQLQELEYLRQQCLNYWQAIIHKMPSSKATYIKFKNSLVSLTELTQKIVDNCELKVKQQNAKQGINTEYYPIYGGGPKPNDVGTYGYNSHFDFYT